MTGGQLTLLATAKDRFTAAGASFRWGKMAVLTSRHKYFPLTNVGTTRKTNT